MPVLNVAFVGSEELARKLGKKGDVRDIESYVHKETYEGDVRILSLLRPLRHPERLRPLLSVLNVAKAGIVEITAVDAALGEVLVAYGAAGIDHGHAIISPEDGGWIDAQQVKMILDQAGLQSWALHESVPDEHTLRESLLSNVPDGEQEAPLVIPIDQHFNVKGVGLVAIGYVQAGTVSKHDEVFVNSQRLRLQMQAEDDLQFGWTRARAEARGWDPDEVLDFIFMDDPRHRSFRLLTAREFTPARLRNLADGFL